MIGMPIPVAITHYVSLLSDPSPQANYTKESKHAVYKHLDFQDRTVALWEYLAEVSADRQCFRLSNPSV